MRLIVGLDRKIPLLPLEIMLNILGTATYSLLSIFVQKQALKPYDITIPQGRGDTLLGIAEHMHIYIKTCQNGKYPSIFAPGYVTIDEMANILWKVTYGR